MSISWILYSVSQIIVFAPVIAGTLLIVRRVKKGVPLRREQESYNSCLAWILDFALMVFKPIVLFILVEMACLIVASQVAMIAGMLD